MHQIRYEVKKNRVYIYIEDELWREGSTAILTYHPKFPTSCSSIEEFLHLYEDLEYKGAKICAYKRVAALNQSSLDLLKYLKSKLVSETTAITIVDELQKLDYINDQTWGESFIKQQQSRKIGRKVIAYKLKIKGFSDAQIDSWLKSHIEEDSELTLIKSLIMRRYGSRDLKDYKQRGKVTAALLRKGFDKDQILQGIEICITSKDK